MAGVDKCILCGLCRQDSSLFKLTGKEVLSARGKALLIKKGILDKIFYIDPLVNVTVAHCPTDVDISEEVRKQRVRLVENGIESKPNRRMIESIREFGTPYGDLKAGDIQEVYS